MAKKLLATIASVVLAVSLTPFGLAFADSSYPYSHSFTAVGIRPELVCPQGTVYEQLDVIWYSNNGSCIGSAFTENGKRYAITEGHVKHLKDRLIKQVNAEYPDYQLSRDSLEFGPPTFEFEKYGYPFQSTVADATLVGNKHFASVSISMDGGSILLNGVNQGLFEPGSTIHVSINPIDGYELISNSLLVSCTDTGQQYDVSLDDNFDFVMPDSCIVVSAGFGLAAPVEPDPAPAPEDPIPPEPVGPAPVDPTPLPEPSPLDPTPTPEPEKPLHSPEVKPETVEKVEQNAIEPKTEVTASQTVQQTDIPSVNVPLATYEPEFESRVEPETENSEEPSTLVAALNTAVANIADSIKPVFSDGEVALATLVQGTMAVVGVGCVGGAAIALFKPR